MAFLPAIIRCFVLSLCLSLSNFAFADSPAQTPSIQFKKNAEDDDWLVYRAIISFLLACSVAYGVAYGVRRYLPHIGNKRRKESTIKRIETMRMTQKTTLFLIQYRDEDLLIAEGDNGVQVLSVKPHHADLG